MKGVVETLHKTFKLHVKFLRIDNFIFQMHYRATTSALLIMVLIISAQELIGENIRCIVDKGVEQKVIDRFCYFTSTYTVVKYLTPELVHSHAVAHAGVGAMGINSDEEVKRHAYYQWVPFVLAFQAIMFYLPHMIWKKSEGGRMKKLSEYVMYAAYSSSDKEISVGSVKVPTKPEMERRFGDLKRYFKDRIIVTRSWALWLIFCEILNLINVILQVWLTDLFLGGQFMTLGSKYLKGSTEEEVDILSVVFPKITKCNFHKYGPSGTIQSHDAMCVMALNIINEKIYVFLWFWFIILFTATCLNLIWRMVSFLLHARNVGFNKMVFAFQSFGKINPWHIATVTKKSNYRDWLFLVYLSFNMDGLVFSNFFVELANELDEYDINDNDDDDFQALYKPINKKE